MIESCRLNLDCVDTQADMSLRWAQEEILDSKLSKDHPVAVALTRLHWYSSRCSSREAHMSQGTVPYAVAYVYNV